MSALWSVVKQTRGKTVCRVPPISFDSNTIITMAMSVMLPGHRVALRSTASTMPVTLSPVTQTEARQRMQACTPCIFSSRLQRLHPSRGATRFAPCPDRASLCIDSSYRLRVAMPDAPSWGTSEEAPHCPAFIDADGKPIPVLCCDFGTRTRIATLSSTPDTARLPIPSSAASLVQCTPL